VQVLVFSNKINAYNIALAKMEDQTITNIKSVADVSIEGFEKKEDGFVQMFKYQIISSYSLDALQKGYVYFSAYEQLNDPFDPFVRLFKSEKSDLIKAMTFEGPKIFCVTPNPANPLMWAQYADGGMGMCIGYAVFLGNPTIFNKVRYRDNIGDNELQDLWDFFLSKSSHWAYEEEWRALQYSNEQKLSGFFHPISIRLGPKCTTENALRIKKVLPKTVKEFYMILPTIQNSKFTYQLYDVDELFNKFGCIPTIDEFVRYKEGIAK
jgi:hypothetical protein